MAGTTMFHLRWSCVDCRLSTRRICPRMHVASYPESTRFPALQRLTGLRGDEVSPFAVNVV